MRYGNIANSKLHAPEDQGSVDSAKGKIVGHSYFTTHLTAIPGNIVDWRTLSSDFCEVECGVKPAIIHHIDGGEGFSGAAGSQSMASVALQRTERDLVSQHSERGLALCDIAKFSSGSVGTDIVYITG